MTDFFKNNLLGIILIAIATGVAGDYIYDKYFKPPVDSQASIPPNYPTAGIRDTQVIIYKPEIQYRTVEVTAKPAPEEVEEVIELSTETASTVQHNAPISTGGQETDSPNIDSKPPEEASKNNIESSTRSTDYAKRVVEPKQEVPIVQHNISGDWRGYATYNRGKKLNYNIHLTQNGYAVNGEIRLSNLRESSYAKYTIVGTVLGDQFTFEGVTLLERHPASATWCLATGNLRIVKRANSISLVGNWGPNPIQNGCPRGSHGEINVQRI